MTSPTQKKKKCVIRIFEQAHRKTTHKQAHEKKPNKNKKRKMKNPMPEENPRRGCS
jgi:hypothetical protein